MVTRRPTNALLKALTALDSEDEALAVEGASPERTESEEPVRIQRAPSSGSGSTGSGWIGKVRIPPSVARFAESVLRRALDFPIQRSPGSSNLGTQYPGTLLLGEALQLVPRDQFVEPRARARVLEDVPLPTGFGQTMAHPFIVARMIAVAGVLPGMRVLELAPGAGYASALMCAMGAQIFGVEEIGLRAQSTRKLLDSMGFHRVLIATDLGAWIAERVSPFQAALSHLPLADAERARVLRLLGHGARLVEPDPEGPLGSVRVSSR